MSESSSSIRSLSWRRLYSFHTYAVLCGSTTTNVPRISRRNRTNRNLNVNLPRHNRSLPPTKIFVEPRLNRISVKGELDPIKRACNPCLPDGRLKLTASAFTRHINPVCQQSWLQGPLLREARRWDHWQYSLILPTQNAATRSSSQSMVRETILRGRSSRWPIVGRPWQLTVHQLHHHHHHHHHHHQSFISGLSP